jgi:hypothetical protein
MGKSFFSHIYINIPYDYFFEKIPGEDHVNIKFIVMGFIQTFEQSGVAEQQQYITKNSGLYTFKIGGSLAQVHGLLFVYALFKVFTALLNV